MALSVFNEGCRVRPWNNWYHCIGTTHGSWVRGDPRGWRAKHHREHVEGDYMRPPAPGVYSQLQRESQKLMKRPPVALDPQQRLAACLAIIEALEHHQVEVVDLAVGAKHYHLLARFTPLDGSRNTPARPPAGFCGAHARGDDLDPIPRYILGKAHSWCTRRVREACGQSPGSPEPGRKMDCGLWAPKPKCQPIRDRAHQLQVVRYIREHEAEGAVVWSRIKAPRE